MAHFQKNNSKYNLASSKSNQSAQISQHSFDGYVQCDQIWRFIGLWTTFQSLWQQLVCLNLPHSQAIFVKVSISLIFLVTLFMGNFYRNLATFYWSQWLRVKYTLQVVGKILYRVHEIQSILIVKEFDSQGCANCVFRYPIFVLAFTVILIRGQGRRWRKEFK